MNSRLTQRAHFGRLRASWWESARFQAISLAQANSGKMALSHPAHQQVTQTVGWLLEQNKSSLA
jgi:hypothetical protein